MSKNIHIELTPWEAKQMSKSLQYLIDDYVKDIENFKEISNDCLKSISWLIAWSHNTFKQSPDLANFPKE
jgi:hypothetical protein